MRTTRLVLLTVACGLLAGPLRADKKLDDAVAKANDQIRKGKVEDAAKTIEKMISQPSAEALTAAARLQLRLGKVEEAAANAAKAVEMAGSATPDVKAAAFATLSQMDLLRGTGKDAVANATKAVEAQGSAAAHAALARAHARMQDPAALASAEKAVAAGASSAEAHEAMGQALLAAGKAAEAQAAFAKALSLDPQLTAARVGSARALLAQNKTAEAVAEGRKATEENPNDGEAFAALGLALLAQGSWNDAISAAQEGKFKNDRNPVVLHAVGRIFEDPKGGNLRQAELSYAAALNVDKDFIPAKVTQVANLERQGPEKLEDAYNKAKELAQELPNSPEAQLVFGRIALRKGDYLGSVQPLEMAAKAMGSNAEVQAMFGTALLYAKQIPEALEAYKKGVALAPSNVDYRTTYGLLLGMNDRVPEAIVELEKVVATPGYKNTAGFTNLGWVYRNADPPQADKAVTAYQKAMELDAKNAQAALGLGWALSFARKYDESIVAFGKAIPLDPKLAGEAYNGIAWDHYFKKDMAKAKEFAAKAKEEGRNVASLLKTIDDFEKGIAAAADAEKKFRENQKTSSQGDPGIEVCARGILKGSPAERRRCATELAKFGRAAVEYLAYALSSDRDFGVRTAAVQSLGAIGDKSVCPQLRGLAANNPYEKTIMTAEEQRLFVAYEDLRKVVRATIAKLGC